MGDEGYCEWPHPLKVANVRNEMKESGRLKMVDFRKGRLNEHRKVLDETSWEKLSSNDRQKGNI